MRPSEYRGMAVRDCFPRGWVFAPLDGKKPIHKGWQEAERPSLEKVIEWARTSNIGLRTGDVSGVVVIDDDSEDSLATTALNLAPTVTVLTGGGHKQFYFKIKFEIQT